jgi:hypothetical protein
MVYRKLGRGVVSNLNGTEWNDHGMRQRRFKIATQILAGKIRFERNPLVQPHNIDTV